MSYDFSFFFFQAEDGIRDVAVTGVQTCALPISRWLAGVMRHGYKGAVEMAATVDFLFGYAATTEVLDDWMYEKLAAAYLLDDTVRAFLRRANPWAERAMIERLLEAAERGLWEAPDDETLRRLRELHGDNDAW